MPYLFFVADFYNEEQDSRQIWCVYSDVICSVIHFLFATYLISFLTRDDRWIDFSRSNGT